MASYSDLNQILELMLTVTKPPRIYETDLRKLIDEKGIKLDMVYFVPMLTQLVQDGYLERFPSEEHYHHTIGEAPTVHDRINYSITFKGILFIKDGGYTEKNRKGHIEKFLKSLATIAIVIGTVSAGAYALKEMIVSDLYRSILFAITLSTAGTISVLILYLRYKK